jgi:molybdate transport system permease protein
MGLYPRRAVGQISLRRFWTNRSSEHHPGWIFILPSLGLIGLLGLPLLALVWKAVGTGFFTNALSPTALSALKLSLLTSTTSVLLVILTGTPLAFILARWKFKGRAAVEVLVDLPLVLPPSVAGLALLIAFGRQGVFGGWLNRIGISLPFTMAAVIMAQAFVSAPLFVRSARVGFAGVDKQVEEAATVEGANEWQLFRFLMFPLAGRALLTGLVLTWTRALGEFGATIMFAGNLVGKTQTMPLAIYLGFERGLGVAIALSVFLILVSVVLLGVMRRLERDSKVDTHYI